MLCNTCYWRMKLTFPTAGIFCFYRGALYFYNFSNKLHRTITRQLWQVKIRSRFYGLRRILSLITCPAFHTEVVYREGKIVLVVIADDGYVPQNLWTLYAAVKLRGWNCKLEKKSVMTASVPEAISTSDSQALRGSFFVGTYGGDFARIFCKNLHEKKWFLS